MQVLGIDIGGTGIKGGIVNLETGELVGERFRLETPQPATPSAVAQTVRDIVKHFEDLGHATPLIGCTFPAIVQNGVTKSAANVDKAWIDHDAQKTISDAVGKPVVIINDADAAGLAEQTWGSAKNEPGSVLVITLGTGIGSALIYNGQLIPNTELGHVIWPKDDIAEHFCSSKVKDDNPDMKWKEYAARLNSYLLHIQLLFSPTKIVIGGGISKKADKYIPLLEGMKCPVVPAALKNEAGIAGAALQASRVAKQ